LNVQNDLKLNFEHIDDSLFALSLRQPMISDVINESLTNVSFNLDKTLELMAENRVRNGVASQQYTVTGANELAILLSELLNNMQNQMQMQSQGQGQGQGKGQGEGEGQGKGFQLPDIIQKQESLSEKMKEGMGKGEGQGKGNEGQSGGDGDGGKSENGRSGEDGDSQGGEGKGGEGNGGKEGKEGKGEGDGDGYNEDLNGDLYEIYKQQQQLRNQLKDRLSKEGLDGMGGQLIKEMEGIEQQLLDKGFNQRTLERMLKLEYELLKLDEADFEQGQESRRESTTNRRNFKNELRLQPEDIKKYFNTTEILNREALPLREKYKTEVKKYFKGKND